MPDTTSHPPHRQPRRARSSVRRVTTVSSLAIAAFVLAGWAGTAFSDAGGLRGVVGTDGRSASAAADGPSGTALDPSATGEAGGIVPDDASAFDEDVPAVAGLDPLLLAALQRATIEASADDVTIVVNSGWRSAAYQGQLLHEAIGRYGTPEEAARWVSTPATSAHVQGDAVDVGSWDATAWLSEHGAAYDLCQIYMNETWHYELRAGASSHGCPTMFRDPTDDPRMQG